ncbi:MAG TPA: DNA polymerase III subunit gamma/tau [Candidatus Paceibacterota bacterium]|nr:DNA polymerase III subunit gamma/tau [Candidatus Paceibacterota bacterium]
MAHALYQKYRPQAFSEVIGQSHVIKALEQAVSSGRPSHAYVLSGGRGTGKTSLARIFAKALGSSDADIIEMDAASHTGVDDVREIIDSASVLPFSSQFKVYILDEAHMLSRAAFNALLKTLEEPPPHALFILATTDPEKLPDTVLSRCAVFLLDKPRNTAIETALSRAIKGESREAEAEALTLMAIMADGSFRDGLSLLEQILRSYPHGKIERAHVEQMTGAPKGEYVSDVLAALDHADPERALKAVRALEADGANPQVFMQLLVSTVRSVIYTRFGGAGAGEELSKESEHTQSLVNSFVKGKHVNSALLESLISLHGEVRRSPMPYVLLEARLITLSEKGK